tara:strand:- start:13070 stop:13723 length:654 start_codon:yes stop_codon:yes gene_type:complete
MNLLKNTRLEIDLQITDYFSISENDKKSVKEILKRNFKNNFTGLLSSRQLENLMLNSQSDSVSCNLVLAKNNNAIIGLAFFGKEYSFFKAFSAKSFMDSLNTLLLLIKLMGSPNILIRTVKNAFSRYTSTEPNEHQNDTHADIYLLYICTDKEVQNKKLGHNILLKLEEYLSQENQKSIYCHFDGENPKVKSFYLSNGWQTNNGLRKKRQIAIKEIQ